MNLISIFGYLILLGLIYLIIAPIPTLVKLKLKYGKEIQINYVPLLGFLGGVIPNLIFRKDLFYSSKYLMKNNPEVKIRASNDLKGGVHFTLIDPDLKKLFFQDQEQFKKMEGLPFADTYLNKGIFFSSGQQWQTARRLLSDHFTYDEIKKIVGTFKKECQTLDLQNGQVNIVNVIKILLSNTMTNTFFGVNNNLKDFGREVNSTMEVMQQFLMNPLIVIRFFIFRLNSESSPQFLLTNLEKTFLNKLQQHKQQITEEIQKRINAINEGKNQEFSLLSTLANAIITKSITMEDGIHQYFNLWIGGIDSTSHTLKNSCYALCKHPHVQEKLREEILKVVSDFDSLDSSHITKMNYLHDFLQECLRFYLPIPSLFTRISKKDLYLDKFFIPKGQSMDVNFIITQFDPVHFKNPLEFNVERWQDKPKNTYAFIPFSAGPRNCVGQHLAMLELKTMLCYLVLNFKLSMNENEQITLGLKNLYGPTKHDFLILEKRFRN